MTSWTNLANELWLIFEARDLYPVEANDLSSWIFRLREKLQRRCEEQNFDTVCDPLVTLARRVHQPYVHHVV